MEIKDTNDYLNYRRQVLEKEKYRLLKSYNSNQLQMAEINNKINEIRNSVDESFEMFSPRAAEESDFNKQEVNELKMKMLLLSDENKELHRKIKEAENELNVVCELASRNIKQTIAERQSEEEGIQTDTKENKTGESVEISGTTDDDNGEQENNYSNSDREEDKKGLLKNGGIEEKNDSSKEYAEQFDKINDIGLSDDVCSKLRMCANIVEYDPRRVKTELLNIIEENN